MSSKKAKYKSNREQTNKGKKTSSIPSGSTISSVTEIAHSKPKPKRPQVKRTKDFERFFTKSFLLNQGSIIFKSLIKSSAYYLLTLAAQLFVFGGGLGLVWVLSHLEPKGDLARYLLPLTILAMPVAVIYHANLGSK